MEINFIRSVSRVHRASKIPILLLEIFIMLIAKITAEGIVVELKTLAWKERKPTDSILKERH